MNQQQMADSAKAYFNTTNRVFLFVAEARLGFGKVEVGNGIEVPETELESNVRVIINLLDAFKNNVYSPDIARRYSDEEYRIFRKHHLSINIERQASGELIIKPLHHEKSGYIGREGERILISMHDIWARLPSALREAVKMAS